MKSIPSIKKLYKVISKNRFKKNDSELWYSRYFGRKVSIYFTWFFLHTDFTPNAVTFISMFFAMVGALLIAIPHTVALILGALFFQLYMILDSTDGEIARYRNLRSPLGSYLDQVMHVIAYIALFSCMGLNIYLRTKSDIGLFLGFGTSLLYTLASFVHYLDPLLNTDSYKASYLKIRSNQSTLLRQANNIYNIVTGDIEIVLFLLVVAPFQYLSILQQDIFALILMTNMVLLLLGGVLFNLYKKLKDQRYQASR